MQVKNKYFFLACLFFFNTPAFSQIDIINTTFNVRDSNVIFTGFDNYLIIKVATTGNYDLVANKSLVESQKSKNQFKVYSKKNGVDTFYVKRNGKTLFVKYFIIKELSPIKFRLGAIRRQEALKAEIIANRKIIIDNPDCNCQIPHHVYSYYINIKSNKVTEAEKHIAIEGANLSALAISTIEKLERGDIIEFTDIKGIIYNGCPREFPPFRLKVQ